MEPALIDLAAWLAALEAERVELLDAVATPAERMRAKRLRDKAGPGDAGSARPGRAARHEPAASLFRAGRFIVVDGEGVTEGRAATYSSVVEGVRRTYTGAAHYMILLAASTGDEISVDTGRLSMKQSLDFLLDVSRRNPKSIMVCYGGSYDINQMLLYGGLSRDDLLHVNRSHKTAFRLDGHAYRIEYRPRKMLRVWRWANEFVGYHETKGGNLVREKPEAMFTLWDTQGFFQSSFTTTMQKWLGKEHADYLHIESMKAKRPVFTRAMLPEMREYNRAECRALVQVMDKFRSSIEGLSLTLNRWDGAGAIAGAMNAAHDIRDAKAETPTAVFDAARVAFSGGHIEVCQFGSFPRPIHHYDLNSAYPAIIRDLPDLSGATWQHGVEFDPWPGFTLVRVRYAFAKGMPFYPLFFRALDGSIAYPQSGEGWYWYPEFEAARDFYTLHGGSEFEVIEWWHCKPRNKTKPFAFVQGYYDTRRNMVERDKSGLLTETDAWMQGAEKIIKLGINSLYGKMAQQLGGINGQAPPYFQLEWAGYVTAGCRAQLMRAAMQNPAAVISFATDGLFCTERLDLDCPADKLLGAWAYQQHDGMVLAMPGVYWLYDTGQVIGQATPAGAYSRGFDKAYVSTPELVLDAWQRGRSSVELPMRRLVTMGSACSSGSDAGVFWRARGRFLDGTRTLDISGGSRKRLPPRQAGPLRLWERSARTPPRANTQYLDWIADGSDALDPRGLSAPYKVRWLDDDAEDNEHDAGAIEDQEMLDAEFDFG